MSIQIGDILFYRPSNTLVERIIQKFEGGKNAYVHCAIAIGDDVKIEALPGGIVQDKIVYIPDGVFSSRLRDLPDALTWLKLQAGQAYGFIDCVDAVLASFERSLIIPDKWFDCSALATEFLMRAGGVDLGGLTQDVHIVTPQELANQLGIV